MRTSYFYFIGPDQGSGTDEGVRPTVDEGVRHAATGWRTSALLLCLLACFFGARPERLGARQRRREDWRAR